MKFRTAWLLLAAVAVCPLFVDPAGADETVRPLKVLLIAGGCCHDYGKQKDVLKEGLESRAHVQVKIVYSEDTSTKARFDIYKDPHWARGYDVVIHDECTSDV